jgi:hypothetical protein
VTSIVPDPIVNFNSGLTSASIIGAAGNINVVATLNVGDSFAPASGVAPIPEPTAALTFAAGLAITGWRARRQSQA